MLEIVANIIITVCGLLVWLGLNYVCSLQITKDMPEESADSFERIHMIVAGMCWAGIVFKYIW